MTEEQLEKARPYLADEELKAQYPDVDFDMQKASDPRIAYVSRVVKQYGRDQRFLLALVLSGGEAIECCKILRVIIRDYRYYTQACIRERVPYERIEIVEVDDLRRIVYKVFPEADSMDMYIKVLNDIVSLQSELALLRRQHDEDQEALRKAAVADQEKQLTISILREEKRRYQRKYEELKRSLQGGELTYEEDTEYVEQHIEAEALKTARKKLKPTTKNASLVDHYLAEAHRAATSALLHEVVEQMKGDERMKLSEATDKDIAEALALANTLPKHAGGTASNIKKWL